MRKQSFLKAACAVAVSAACALGIAGCASPAESGSTVEGLTGGIAATINGDIEIPEDEVTTTIQDARASMGLTSQEDWGMWMAENDYTPESVREEIIDGLVAQELIRLASDDRGITVDADTVQGYIDSMKANYDSEEAWNEALAAAGITEDDYRNNIELSLLQNDLIASFASDEEPSEEDLLTYANIYAPGYDGAKRSSHILFNLDDEDTAKQVLEQLRNGDIEFTDAVEQYSQDAGSAANGGDVGWDALTSFVPEYQTGLNELENVGDISDLVQSQYGYHIIELTDIFDAPEEITSMDQLPQEFQEFITNIVVQSNQSTAYGDYMTEYQENADVVINPMPENVPYNVDMAPYEEAVAEQEAADGETAEDGTVADDGVIVIDGDTTDEATDDTATDEAADADTTDTADDKADADTDTADDTAKDDADTAKN